MPTFYHQTKNYEFNANIIAFKRATSSKLAKEIRLSTVCALQNRVIISWAPAARAVSERRRHPALRHSGLQR
ncbi:hypothetical protein AGR7C_Lc220158 [Agrobacterium deltaense Zutra 3/1]|uniref:Uncharacterized protein n=1 Tax=Agrobacterium deltaense Zutra 3/1 TaxID=1183427 RepID=A0A1S7RTJ2_9HYPH|nr:hypothetical protein AGR7C_Lc220158 [Agrobacterium deltaense Zutra 3/1]